MLALVLLPSKSWGKSGVAPEPCESVRRAGHEDGGIPGSIPCLASAAAVGLQDMPRRELPKLQPGRQAPNSRRGLGAGRGQRGGSPDPILRRMIPRAGPGWPGRPPATFQQHLELARTGLPTELARCIRRVCRLCGTSLWEVRRSRPPGQTTSTAVSRDASRER